MLRNRALSVSGGRISLKTHFLPSSDDDLDLEHSACLITFDPSRSSTLLDVARLVVPSGDAFKIDRKFFGNRYPLPSFSLLKEEMDFMFNLINQLWPYESSPSSQSQDLQEI